VIVDKVGSDGVWMLHRRQLAPVACCPEMFLVSILINSWQLLMLSAVICSVFACS